MERRICAYRNYFTDFIASIKEVEARKVFYVLDMLKVQERLSEKFVKQNVVLLFNGFTKKTQKTPRREIDLAKRLKKEYYAEKRK